MVTADYDCDALLRKADSPVEGEHPTTLMTACYILMSIIIVLLIIILRRLNAFIYHFNITKYNIRGTLNHLRLSTTEINLELKYITKCCKENKAKFDYVIKLLRNSSTTKNNKRTKPKTAKSEETK